MASPTKFIHAYVDAVKGRVIYVQAGPSGEFSRISFEAEKQYEITAKFEFAKPSHAELVMSQCMENFLDANVLAATVTGTTTTGWIDLPPGEVTAKIIETADLLGATFHDGKETIQKAERMVAGITAKIEEMRKNGDLQDINRKYKAYRLGQVANGEKAMTYNAYVAEYKAMLVEHSAKLAG